MKKFRLGQVIVLALLHLACGGDDEPRDVDPVYESPGPFAVGNRTITITDAARNRTLAVEVWYPHSRTGTVGEAVEEFVVDDGDRANYEGLLADANASCPSVETHSLRDAIPEGESLPLLVFSHCHNCLRFSSFAIAERLASHGFVVAAPDHAGNTLFDDLAGEGAELDSEFLQAVRPTSRMSSMSCWLGRRESPSIQIALAFTATALAL